MTKVIKFFDGSKPVFGDDDEEMPPQFIPDFMDKNQFLGDVEQMCTPKDRFKTNFPFKNLDISEQLKDPRDLNEIKTTVTDKDGVPLKLNKTEETQVNVSNKFFTEFPDSKEFKDIMRFVGNDPGTARKLITTLLNARKETHPESTLPTILNNTLRLANSNSNFVSMAEEMDVSPGDLIADTRFLERFDVISKLLPEVEVKYRHASRKSYELHETVHPDDEMEPRRIRSSGEIPMVSEMCMDDDLFTAKMMTNELHTFQNYSKEYKAQTYCMLIDVSGSMGQWVTPRGRAVDYATASAISLVSNALKGANRVFLILFDTAPDDPIEFTSTKDAVDFLYKTPFSGGGTSIDRALKAMDEIEPDEGIILTDGGDHVSYKPKTKLFTVFFGEYMNKELIDVSHSFERIGG